MSKSTKFIWVCSYPKSGNTWMRHLLKEYYARTQEHEPWDVSDKSVYWYQTVAHKPIRLLTPDETIMLRPAALTHMLFLFSGLKPKRENILVKSHLLNGHTAGVPTFSPFWVDYAVYITRDPRDIVPSFAHHLGKSLEEVVDIMGTKDAALSNREVCEGKLPSIYEPLGTWSDHILSWTEHPGVRTIVTSYEEMHADTAGVLERVLRFFGEDPDREAIEAAVEECRFERLKEKEADGLVDDQPVYSDRPFYRRGEVGSHKDELPTELRHRVERDHRRVMKELGYLE